MATVKKKVDYFTSEEGLYVLNELEAMSGSDIYNTPASYSANTLLYPDNSMTFTNKHMWYLKNHPAVDTRQYISNLRLMTKIK